MTPLQGGSRTRRIRSVGLAAPLLAVAATISPVVAQPPHVAPERYRLDQWTTDTGLPGHTVHELAESPDGRLWVATNGGLVSFDGFAFTSPPVTGSPGPANRVV